jgi:hypothetical protein
MIFTELAEVEENGQKRWKLQKVSTRKGKNGPVTRTYRSVESYDNRELAASLLGKAKKRKDK